MTFEGALIKEQGVTFGIVIVKNSVLHSLCEREHVIAEFSVIFQGVPVVLMAQDSQGIPEYFGRNDIVKFLSHVSPTAIPWKKYTIG